MKKTLMTIILLLAISISCVSADNLIESDSKDITAYKRIQTSGVPAAEGPYIRILDPDEGEIIQGEIINIPETSRQAFFHAFSWIVSGNLYGVVDITLTFKPMYWHGDSTSTMIIPYDVKIKHTSSRIGNTVVPVGRNPTSSAQKVTNDYSTNYFYYADDVDIYLGNSVVATTADSDSSISTTGDIKITNAEKTVRIEYDMSEYTQVYNASDQLISNPNSVCDYWNRRGNVYMYLRITTAGRAEGNGGQAFTNGMYYADVVVGVTAL